VLVLAAALVFAPPPPEIEVVEPPPGPVEGPTSEAPPAPPEPGEAPAALPDLRLRLEIDLPILVGSTAVFAVTEGFKGQIAPQSCNWCAPPPGTLKIREALLWSDPEAAALTSDIVGYGVIPAVALTLTLVGVGTEGEWRKIHEDLIVALEAVALSGALTNTVKFASGRRRPYAYAADPAIPFAEDPDQNLSFPSGHSSLAFSMATSFATVATLRRRRLAPVYWGLGVPMAAFVAYLRMAGDRHWFGDVLAGAGLGTLVGVGLPWLLHHPRTGVIPRKDRSEAERAASVTIVPGARGVSIAGRF
jgi:membrane-associated phospholipid phosphatase